MREFLIAVFCLYSCLLSAVQHFIPLVISKLPHHFASFTQGLAIEGDQLYESTGLYGQSHLQQLDILTGKIVKKIQLSSEIFAEGLAAFPHHIFQISWREEKVFIYDRASFKLQRTLRYSGEGWGLCRDGETVWMSDGSSVLTQRKSDTFAVLKKLTVHQQEYLVDHLNDLECVGNDLYANIWTKNLIARINKETGEVTGIIDASQLLLPQEKRLLSRDGVLNGIAFYPKTQTFFLTGKNWPWIFEVVFVPRDYAF